MFALWILQLVVHWFTGGQRTEFSKDVIRDTFQMRPPGGNLTWFGKPAHVPRSLSGGKISESRPLLETQAYIAIPHRN